MSKQQDLINVFGFLAEFLREKEDVILDKPKNSVEESNESEKTEPVVLTNIKPWLSKGPTNIDSLLPSDAVDRTLNLMKRVEDIDNLKIHDKVLADSIKKKYIPEIVKLKADLEELNAKIKTEEEVESEPEPDTLEAGTIHTFQRTDGTQGIALSTEIKE